jgi:hypothetical protein
MSDGKNLPNKPVDPVAGPAPTALEVRRAHTNADTDGGEGSIHHTLGSRKGQSSPGDHDHRGGSSVLLLDGATISGSRGGNAAVASIIAALVELGATDTTTA